MSDITIYSTTTCPWCSELKSYLTKNGMSFVERYVDLDESAKEEMRIASGGFLGVPFTVIKTDSGELKTVVGFDKGKLNEILSIRQ